MDLLSSIKGFLRTSTFPQFSYKSFKTFLKPHITNLKLTNDQKGGLAGCQISEEEKAGRGTKGNGVAEGEIFK